MTYFIMLFVSLLFLPNQKKQYANINKLKYSKAKPHKHVIRKTDIRYLLAFLTVFIVSGLRYGVGTDYFYTYAPGYLFIKDYKWYGYYETGFVLINKFCLLFSGNYQTLFIVTSIIIYGLLFYIIRRYSIDPRTSFLVFFLSSMFFNSLSNIRQAMAMTICLLAVMNYLENDKKQIRKLIEFYLLVFLAYEFHTSAIMWAIIPFVTAFDHFKLKYHVVIATCLSVIALGLNISGIASSAFNFFLVAFSRYAWYESTGAIYLSFLMLNVAIYLLMYLSANYDSRFDKRTIFYLNIQFISVIIMLFSNILPVAERVARYFMFVQIISSPYFMHMNISSKKREAKIINIVWWILLASWCVFYIVKYGADGCFPYQSIVFVKEPWQKRGFGIYTYWR